MTGYQERLSSDFAKLAAASEFRVLNVCQKTGSTFCDIVSSLCNGVNYIMSMLSPNEDECLLIYDFSRVSRSPIRRLLC